MWISFKMISDVHELNSMTLDMNKNMNINF